MAKSFTVTRDNKPCYDIIIRYNFDDLADFISQISDVKYTKACIVTDSHVGPLYAHEIQDKLSGLFNLVITHTFEAGEKNKQLSTIENLYEDLIRNHFTRGDLLIALGGGVVGDMTGFAAATYLRGIDFIQVPTTLLSQVDSSIGGKTGVDFKGYKNMVGAFYMPKLVYINTKVLSSLPPEQFSSGMGEVLKHGLIRDREYYYGLIQDHDSVLSLDDARIEYLIYTSNCIKGTVVAEDPTEKGVRAILNFGHTIGHAIEKCMNFSLYHGQCVALGMVAAGYISMKRGYISTSDFNDIKKGLDSYDLPTKLADSKISSHTILETTRSDKKMSSAGIKFVLLNTIGDAYIDDSVSDEEMIEAIEVLING